MSSNRSLRVVLVLALVFSQAACYTLYPLETPTPLPATRIVAALTDSGTVAMSDAIGPGAVQVEGVVIGADESRWELQLLRVEHRDQRSVLWNREPVAFPSRALANPLERRLNKKRSWLMAGAVTIGVVVAASIFKLVGADEVIPIDPVPPN